MQPLRGASATVRIGMTRMLVDLPVMYAQGGFTGVLAGTILGIVAYQLRSRGVALAGSFSIL